MLQNNKPKTLLSFDTRNTRYRDLILEPYMNDFGFLSVELFLVESFPLLFAFQRTEVKTSP